MRARRSWEESFPSNSRSAPWSRATRAPALSDSTAVASTLSSHPCGLFHTRRLPRAPSQARKSFPLAASSPPQPAFPSLPRYYELMRHASPFEPTSMLLIRPVFAGCGEPLLRRGASRRYLRGSFPGCLDPYPGGSRGACTRFFPQDFGLPRVATGSAPCLSPYCDFCTDPISGLQSFLDVQAFGFARHSGRTYPPDRPASSRGFSVRAERRPLPIDASDMLVV
jgi:hypothetical protein